MKRILSIIFSCLLLFAGCGEKKSHEVDAPLSTEQPPMELEIVCKNYSGGHTSLGGVVLIDNLSILRSVCISIMGEPEGQLAYEKMIVEGFDETFFKRSLIYAYIESETSGSIRLTAKSAEFNGDKLTLYMERKVPELGTADMASQICFFGIRRDKIKNVKSVIEQVTEVN